MNTSSRYDPKAAVPCDTCWRRAWCQEWCIAAKGWLNNGDKLESKPIPLNFRKAAIK